MPFGLSRIEFTNCVGVAFLWTFWFFSCEWLQKRELESFIRGQKIKPKSSYVDFVERVDVHPKDKEALVKQAVDALKEAVSSVNRQKTLTRNAV